MVDLREGPFSLSEESGLRCKREELKSSISVSKCFRRLKSLIRYWYSISTKGRNHEDI